MSVTVLYMSMSLDGYIAGPNERPDNPLGDAGERLHERPLPGAEDGANRQIYDEFMATGAIVAGKGTFEPAGGWGGDHHDGAPIFIYSRQEPGIDIGRWPLVTYVDDVRTAIARAKAAAGDNNVLVHGAAVAQLALEDGLLDEIEIHLIPVLLGQGRRLFDNLGPEHIELERRLQLRVGPLLCVINGPTRGPHWSCAPQERTYVGPRSTQGSGGALRRTSCGTPMPSSWRARACR